MALKLNRASNTQTVTVAAGAATSSVITLDGFAMGMIHLPSTYDSIAITFTVCDTIDGTYQTLEDSAGNAVALVVEASKSYALPEALFGSPFYNVQWGV